MSAEAASSLVQAVIASSAATLLIIVLRKVLRRGVGARAAYWSWLFVPAAGLIVLLPRPTHPGPALTGLAMSPVHAAVSAALSLIAKVASPPHYGTMLLGIWLAGILVSLAIILRRHRAFVSSLGEVYPQPDGSLRAASCKEPMLFGILRPRIVLPADFEAAYGPNERAMVLAHERAHWRRRDPQVNACAALWLSLSWFNPLMYWAHRLFRFDQELACDATVLALPGTTRRGYADALLKTQLGVDLARNRTTLGCLWHSIHPLAERIHMLKHPLPSELRRRAGLAAVIACVVTGCYAMHTAQSQAALHGAQSPLIAVNMKAYIDGAEVLARGGSTTGWDVLVHSGGQFSIGSRDQWVNCTVQRTLQHLDDTGKPTQQDGSGADILLSCKLSRSKAVFATPTLLARDGETATIIETDPQNGINYRLEFNASSSAARIAAASGVKPSHSANGVVNFQLQH